MVFAIAAPARQGSAAEGPIYCPLAIPAALATLFRLCELPAHASTSWTPVHLFFFSRNLEWEVKGPDSPDSRAAAILCSLHMQT